ncbi:hypothetical protein [Parvibaculum sp.]|uniref:hypothetical protein n=1 Tax=Parvibaculum sp. TaxID=2024848 RepID=UPI001D90F8EC|nr:hypothetical protein [Parvibaculum sp.]MBX3490880.1 hypothetical protein [Parvibaculum sp.]
MEREKILIRRGKHDSRFSIIPNDTSDDMSLSYEALGLLVYLIAKPQDWRVRIPDLTKRKGTGRDRCYKLLAELEQAGYIVRERIRRKGKMGEIEYVVYDTPRSGVSSTSEQPDEALPHPEIQEVEKTPRPEKPDTEKPDTANQDTYKGQTPTKDGKSQRTEAACAAQPDLLGESEPAKPRRKAKHPMPKDFPSNTDLDWARGHWSEKGATGLVATDEFERFRNHHTARGSLFADWSAAWRTWAMNAVRFAAQKPTSAGAGPAMSDDQRWRGRVESLREKGVWSPQWGPRPGEQGCLVPKSILAERNAA